MIRDPDITKPSTVSVIVAAHNAAATLADTLLTLARQTLAPVEIIVVDDGSTDGTRGVADRFEAAPVRCLALTPARGPAAARNAALDVARGDFIAVVDADDLIHPERLERLVRAAERTNADMVADDLIAFEDHGATRRAWPFFGFTAEADISLAAYVAGNHPGRSRALGYLKPLFRRALFSDHGLRYDEHLAIGEDFDLVLRALGAGARLRVIPEALYFYRRHPGSISHRLSVPALDALIGATTRAQARHPADHALARRRRLLERERAFVQLVADLKARSWSQARQHVVEDPSLLPRLARSAAEGVWRRLRTLAAAPRPVEPRIVLVSRQRLHGATTGSSAYVLALARALADAGHTVDLLVPTRTAMGRWPVMRLGAEMRAFRRIRMRGTLRLGRWVINTTPAAWSATARMVVARVIARLNGPTAWLQVRPAPYTIAHPWTLREHLEVMRHSAGATALIADYVFQVPALAHALQPAVPRVVILHDLFHRRDAQFKALGAQDSVATLTEADERRLVQGADVVVAIQADEAAWARAAAPRARVVVAPMVRPVAQTPAPGIGHKLLFVGSGTAPNVIGLTWFLEAVWPSIRRERPDADLCIVGAVALAMADAPGLRRVGPVPDLDPFYREAGVVISPLTAGSGLKVKLVEAMAHGKAVVATSVTLQGVADMVGNAVRVADTADAFARHVLDLMSDDAERARLAASALERARGAFGPGALADFVGCFEPIRPFQAPHRQPAASPTTTQFASD